MTTLTTTTPVTSTFLAKTPVQRMLDTVGPLRELIDIVWWTDVVPLAYKQDRMGRFSEDKIKSLLLVGALLGNSLNVDPFIAWANIFPTGNSRMGMLADFKVALVQAAGHTVETVERKPDTCTVRGRRKGSEQWVELTLTIQDAVTAGWGRNPLYRTVPGDMLYHRTSGRVADMVGADVTNGLVTYEDYADLPEKTEAPAVEAAKPRQIETGDVIRSGLVAKLLEERQQEQVQEARPITRHTNWADVVRAHDRTEAYADAEEKLAKMAPLPTLDEEVPDDDEGPAAVLEKFEAAEKGVTAAPQDWPAVTQPEEEHIDAATWAAINNLFRNSHEIKGDGQTEARMRVIKHIIGRGIERGGQMTVTEGQLVRQKLLEWPPATVQRIAYEEGDQDG